MEMAKENMEEMKELSAQVLIRNYIKGYVDSFALKCAVELRIADIIHNHSKPITLSDIATALPLPSVSIQRLERLMRYWVNMGLFTHEKDDSYRLTRCAKYLLREEKRTLAPMVLGGVMESAMGPWNCLSSSLEGGQTGFERYHGMSAWEYVSNHPELSQLFNESMACDTRLVLPAVVQGCGSWLFKGITSLVDVGGGNGTAVMEIVKEFPGMKCTVFDLPHVIRNSAESTLAASGVEWLEGDMFKSVPHADAVLLKWILHDWSDEDCVKILQQCRKAIPEKGGKVIIVDMVMDVDDDPEFIRARLASDLDMMVYLTGKERTKQEWKSLIQAAGYSKCQITPIKALQSVIEAFPS